MRPFLILALFFVISLQIIDTEGAVFCYKCLFGYQDSPTGMRQIGDPECLNPQNSRRTTPCDPKISKHCMTYVKFSGKDKNDMSKLIWLERGCGVGPDPAADICKDELTEDQPTPDGPVRKKTCKCLTDTCNRMIIKHRPT